MERFLRRLVPQVRTPVVAETAAPPPRNAAASEAPAVLPARAAPSRLLPRALMAPAIVTLFLWMIVPLAMSLYFSTVHYNLMQPGEKTFLGLANFEFFVTDPDFGPSVVNTLVLLGSVILITV